MCGVCPNGTLVQELSLKTRRIWITVISAKWANSGCVFCPPHVGTHRTTGMGRIILTSEIGWDRVIDMASGPA